MVFSLLSRWEFWICHVSNAVRRGNRKFERIKIVAIPYHSPIVLQICSPENLASHYFIGLLYPWNHNNPHRKSTHHDPQRRGPQTFTFVVIKRTTGCEDVGNRHILKPFLAHFKMIFSHFSDHPAESCSNLQPVRIPNIFQPNSFYGFLMFFAKLHRPWSSQSWVASAAKLHRPTFRAGHFWA